MLTTKKKIFSSFLLLCILFVFSCNGNETLLLLNWGEYINTDLLDAFEEKYHVTVNMSITDSNELFYSKVKSGTTAYDLVIPSDYMVEKMVEKDLIQKIQFDLLTNYGDDNPLLPGVNGILDLLKNNGKEYCVPYFWGSFGIMYNKNKPGLEEVITNPNLTWDAFFNPSLLPVGTRVGMYDVPRFAYAAGLMSLGYDDPNLYNSELLSKVQSLLSNAHIYEWGYDTLKKGIISGNLDLAFTYTGDLLDMLYMQLDEGKPLSDITFDIVIPDKTIAFSDNFVIPKKARHVELAHKFIDFFLDPENAYINASTVGYCTPVLSAYNKIINYVDDPSNADNDWLNNWAYANKKYYPILPSTSAVNFKGKPLQSIDQNIIDKINQMINQVKTR
jgi:spermidine/putrescine-binding protein